MSKEQKSSRSIARIRAIVAAVVFLGLGIGLILHFGVGTLSSFGYKAISFICPLGALETFLATKTLVPRALIAFVVIAIFVVLFGKVFCGWICPTPHITSFFAGKKGAKTKHAEKVEILPNEDGELAPIGGKRDGLQLDLRHAVLGGSLLSAAIFGFPVFCLICPIGLSFGVILALFQLFGLHEPTWMLVVFPAILVVELVLCKRWCTKFCPLGALMSLLSQKAPFLKPVVEKSKCLRSKGENCATCVNVCPEQLDPHSSSIGECTKCGECAEACPAQAISIKLSNAPLLTTCGSAKEEGNRDE